MQAWAQQAPDQRCYSPPTPPCTPGCITLLAKLFAATQSAALWPAMREWLIDHGGIKSLWAALARSMALAEQEGSAAAAVAANGPLSTMRETIAHYSTLGPTLISALALTDELQFTTSTSSGRDELSLGREELALLPGLIASMTILFSDILPRELAAGHAHEWDTMLVLRHIVMIRFQSRSVGSTCQWAVRVCGQYR